MARQAIKQAEHIDCPHDHDDDEEAFTVEDKTFLRDEDATIVYDVRCTCGHKAQVRVSKSGTEADDSITYENASWNQ